MNGGFDISSQYKDLIGAVLGFAICFIAGLLFMLLMPLCCCCFCFCRCCCKNCGGSRVAKRRSNDQCKQMGFAQALFLMSLAMGGAAAGCYLVNDRIAQAYSLVNTTVRNNIDDVKTFLNVSINQMEYVAADQFSLVSQAIVRDINDIGSMLGQPIVDDLKPRTTSAINSVLSLETTISDTLTALENFVNSLETLDTKSTALADFLTALGTNISSTKSSCTTYCTPTTTCNAIHLSVLTLNTLHPDLSEMNQTRATVQNIKDDNLTASILTTQATLDKIPEMITNETMSFTAAIPGLVDSFALTIQNTLSTLTASNGTLGGFDFDSYKVMIEEYLVSAQTYEQYRWYGGLGLMSVFLIIVFCLLLGICCGCLGRKKHELPTERGKAANCGGCCIILYIFVDTGSIAGFNIAETLLGNASISLSLYNVLLSVQLDALDILSPSTLSSLQSLKDSGASSINFTYHQLRLGDSLISFDINAIITALSTAASQCSNPVQDEMAFHKSQLEYVRDTLIPNAEAELGTNVFHDRVMGYVTQFKIKLLQMLDEDLALCRPVWNAYNSIVEIFCLYLMDVLNAFWFSLGCGLFLFLPSIVTGVKLSRYYFRMHRLGEGYEPVTDTASVNSETNLKTDQL
ncbi:hypothetical protein CAPTEDRAFT_227753 [Capitella teleta]|uniref:Uncharacterized protein n=1 Tax=Capitella teleta TaxID=283909 RepID=R7UNA6_CAPTE|nr:hypothetical protein CAPTEDRAFT_227753 [Capitella teleta]|eukprot:ELU04876.1 hypothetical protein CAPTEDRAFT_227753 [Capitella teleta]